MTAKKNTPMKPKARGGKPLMSELLKDTRKYLKQAEQADVESLREFLFNEPERPFLCLLCSPTLWHQLRTGTCHYAISSQLSLR